MCVCKWGLTVLTENLWQRPGQPDHQTQAWGRLPGNKRKMVRFVVTLYVLDQMSLLLMIQSNTPQESAEHQPGVWVCCSGTSPGLGSHVPHGHHMSALNYSALMMILLIFFFLSFSVADKSPHVQLDVMREKQMIRTTSKRSALPALLGSVGCKR